MQSRNWILTAVVLGSGIVFLDTTVVNVALTAMGRELPSDLFGTLEAQSYVYYAFLLTLSALLIPGGALADARGRRLMFAIGLVGFGVTSLLCAVAPNMELLIGARMLQGATGAILVPGSLAIINASFHGEEQGRAFGLWAGASGATTILGPVVGGVLVAYFSWRAIFLINVPLVALGLWATYRHVPESRDEEASGRLDWLGAALAILAIGGLAFGAIRGQAQQWMEAAPFVALGIGVAAMVVLPIWLLRAARPLIPLRLFRSRNFTVTNISTLLIYGALYVTFQFMAIFLIGTLGYNEVAVGLGFIPSTLFLVFLSARFGALAVRHGPRLFMAIGPAIMGLGLLWYARIPADSEPWVFRLESIGSWLPSSGYLLDLLPGTLVFGVGISIMVAPLITALMRSVPVRNSGVASAFNNMISRVGAPLAGALLFVAISASFWAMLAGVAGIDPDDPEMRSQISPLNPPPASVEPMVADTIRNASTDAFHLAMLAGALLCFAGAAVNWVGIRDAELRRDEAEAATAAASAGSSS